MSEGGDFWARRKAAVAAEAQAEVQAQEEASVAAAQAELEEKSDAEILEQLDLPDPDTLQQGDDFSAFLAKAVPERIRRRALRKLWLSNPVLANVDSLVDYGEDFTDSALVVDGLQTAYQVGKGMLKHVEEMARQAEAKQAQSSEIPLAGDASSDDAADVAEASAETSPAEEPLQENAALVSQHASDRETEQRWDDTTSERQPEAQEVQVATPTRRRLRFEPVAADKMDQERATI